ncbi:MAG: GNAT family N-acetyltransferase [Bacteroidia bacterium]
MSLKDYPLIRLTETHTIKLFDCGDNDLNDFLFNDSKNFQNNLLTVTYLIESEKETVAFYSLLNDKISIAETDSKSKWNKKIGKDIPFSKRFKSYPAIKIARLGVSSNHKGKGYGNALLDYLKQLFITNNRTG